MIISSMLSFFILTSLVGIIVNKYLKYRYDQVLNLFNVYRYIPIHIINILKDYFINLTYKILKKKSLTHINDL